MMNSLERNGYALAPDVFSADCVVDLLAIIEPYCQAKFEDSGRSVHAIRNLFDVLPVLSDVAALPDIRKLIEPVLGQEAFVVRAIFFDKLPGANWKVSWHQDQTIAVKDRIDVPGFGPWSVKESVQHVEPPVSILENMLTVRIHLDDCGEDNGPLRVIPGSHRLGRLMVTDTNRLKKSTDEIACTVKAGGVVLMRPLVLHASSPSVRSKHRRVIHIEFANTGLPGGLSWAAPTAPANPV